MLSMRCNLILFRSPFEWSIAMGNADTRGSGKNTRTDPTKQIHSRLAARNP